MIGDAMSKLSSFLLYHIILYHVIVLDCDADKCLDNVENNLGPRGMAGNASVQRLIWASAEDIATFDPPYDLIIAGDCLYEEACISPLLQTMCALAGPDTEVGVGCERDWLASYFFGLVGCHYLLLIYNLPTRCCTCVSVVYTKKEVI